METTGDNRLKWRGVAVCGVCLLVAMTTLYQTVEKSNFADVESVLLARPDSGVVKVSRRAEGDDDLSQEQLSQELGELEEELTGEEAAAKSTSTTTTSGGESATSTTTATTTEGEEEEDTTTTTPVTTTSDTTTTTSATTTTTTGAGAEAKTTTTSSSSSDTTTTSTTTTTTTTTTSPTTTTTTEPLPCSEKPFPLSSVCPLTSAQEDNYLGKEVLLEELADTMYSSMVLDGLANTCVNGSWCLGYSMDNELLLGDRRVYMQYCHLDDCLNDISDDCMTPTRRLTISTFRLLCEVRKRNVSDRCILGIKKMAHVALVDEVEMMQNDTKMECKVNEDGTCNDICTKVGQQLKCTWAACSHQVEPEVFAQYSAWRWVFTADMDANDTRICDVNNTMCAAFSDSPVLELKVFQELFYHIQQNGPAVLAGVVTAIIVTIGGFGIIFWACAKKAYKYYEYSRDRVEYCEVKSSGEEDEEGEAEETEKLALP